MVAVKKPMLISAVIALILAITVYINRTRTNKFLTPKQDEILGKLSLFIAGITLGLLFVYNKTNQ